MFEVQKNPLLQWIPEIEFRRTCTCGEVGFARQKGTPHSCPQILLVML